GRPPARQGDPAAGLGVDQHGAEGGEQRRRAEDQHQGEHGGHRAQRAQHPLRRADPPQLQQALRDRVQQRGAAHQDLLIRGAARATDSESSTGASELGPSQAVTGTPASRSSRTVLSRSIRRIAQASGQNRSETWPSTRSGLPRSTETSPMLGGRVSTTITSAPWATSTPIWAAVSLLSSGVH